MNIKHKKIIIIPVLLVMILTYLSYSNFNSIKNLINYGNLKLTEPEVLSPSKDEELAFFKIPDNFQILIAAKDLDGPRVILFDPKGRMLVSETKSGRVSILEDKDQNGIFESKRMLIENLKSPHGMDFYKDPKKEILYLYIAETHQIIRYQYNTESGLLTSRGENIESLPSDGRHFTRTIAFGPNFRTSQIIGGIGGVNTQIDKKLYISVGSSCDVCEENTWKRAAILEADPGGSYAAEFAGGLRNSVFFTFHPVTKEIWATDMGRDNLGDNLPPDEVNIVKVAGSEQKFGARRYGWPFCYGNKIKDKEFKPDKFERIDIPQDCSETESPLIEIPAHSAPLGLAFIPSSNKGWPKEWQGDLLVAFHGSWNRSTPTGYKIVRYNLDVNGNLLSKESVDFVSGWLNLSKDKNKIYGRPVDLKFNPSGALYVSDDSSGIIYLIKPKN